MINLANETKLPFTDPDQIRDCLESIQILCSEAGDQGKDAIDALISNIQTRSLLVDELREKSKWDKRFKEEIV